MPIAHAGGAGAMLSLVTVLAGGIGVVFLLVAIGRIPLTSAGDLVLPLASVAVTSSVAPLMGDVLSDVAAPAAVAGVVLLVWLVVAAVTPIDPRRPVAVFAAVVAAAAAAGLLGPALADGPWREGSDAGEQESQDQAAIGIDLQVPAQHPREVPRGEQPDPSG